MTKAEETFLSKRLLNRLTTAEGSIIPPREAGGTRIPSISNLSITSIGATYTLFWTEPVSPTLPVDHYDIHVTAPGGFNYYASVTRSPAKLIIMAPTGTVLTFVVQTNLGSGLACSVSQCPSVSAVAP